MVNKQRMIDNFLEIAKVESLSLNERNIADLLIKKFDKMADSVYEDDAGVEINGNCGNLIITINGDENIEPILLAAHMDTVGPVAGKNPRFDGEWFKSDGRTVLGGDDVAGIVVILEAITCIKEQGIKHGKIQVVLTVAEEIGLLGSKSLDYSKIAAKYGFIMDSIGDISSVVIKAPCHNIIKIDVVGKAVHAGIEPENGVNAIVIAAKAIAKLHTGRIDEITTSNVGIIEGGRATNVVCDKVSIKAEVRSLNIDRLEEETSNMVQCFTEEADKLGGKAYVNVSCEYTNFEIDKNSKIVDILKSAAEESKLMLKLEASGGGSDTNIFNAKGIESVNLSIGAKKIHSVEETLNINDLLKSGEFLISIIKAVTDKG